MDEVQPGSRTELEGTSARLGEQLAAPLAQPGLLGLGERAVRALLDAIGAPSTAPEAAEAAPEASDVVPRLVVRDSSAPAPSPGR